MTTFTSAATGSPCDFDGVNLIAPGPLTSEVAARLDPFISECRAPSSGSMTWTIRMAGPDVIDEPGDRVSFAGRAEPPITLWFNRKRRELIVTDGNDVTFRAHMIARLVRMMLRLDHAAAGAVFLHAGMFVDRGRGVVVVGAKRAGKTSTVLTALRRGAAFVGNDDVSLWHNGTGWVGRGWPRSVKVRNDSLSILGIDATRTGTHPASTTIGDVLDPSERSIGATLLYPRELSELCQSSLSPKFRVDLLVFPRFGDSARPSLTPLKPTAVVERLRANLLSPPVKDAGFLLPAVAEPDSMSLTESIRTLAGHVPAVDLHQRFDALRAGFLSIRQHLTKETSHEHHLSERSAGPTGQHRRTLLRTGGTQGNRSPGHHV